MVGPNLAEIGGFLTNPQIFALRKADFAPRNGVFCVILAGNVVILDEYEVIIGKNEVIFAEYDLIYCKHDVMNVGYDASLDSYDGKHGGAEARYAGAGPKGGASEVEEFEKGLTVDWEAVHNAVA